jgi:hypothetical protein
MLNTPSASPPLLGVCALADVTTVVSRGLYFVYAPHRTCLMCTQPAEGVAGVEGHWGAHTRCYACCLYLYRVPPRALLAALLSRQGQWRI